MIRSLHLGPVLALGTGLLVLACGGGEPGTADEAETAGAAAGPRLYVLDCGHITTSDMSLFTPGENEGVELELVISCYLIRHPDGTLLWDTGVPDALAEQPDGMTNGPFHIWVERTLESQLEEIGVTPEEIDYLAISHLHFDHTGNANRFARSIWLVQEGDFDAGFGPDPESYRFDPSSYAELEARAMKIDGDHDVFGDGSVVILSAPGHTPGHQVLFVDLAEHGPTVLSGDLYHFAGNREARRIPVFNWDAEASFASIDRIEATLETRGATLIIQHDPEQFARLPHAPDYLK